MQLEIQEISEEKFFLMSDTWTSLMRTSMANDVFLSWEWISIWWTNFKGNGRELYILTGVGAGEEIVGIAPFYIERQSSFGFSARSVVKFCASTDTDSDHLDLVCSKEHYIPFLEALIRYLSQQRRWDLIDLAGVRQGSLLIDHINVLGQHFIVKVEDSSRCPYLPVNGEFETYLGTFSSKKRYNLMRNRKLLLEKNGCVYEVYKRPEDLVRMLDKLFELHLDRAKRKGIKSKLKDPAHYRFHKSLVSIMGEKGKATLIFLRRNKLHLAACYFLIYNKKYYYYQSGLSYEGEMVGAGTVLLSLGIEDAFRENFIEFDFLRGMEEYKSYWAKATRENYRIIMRKRNLTGWVGSLAYRCRKIHLDDQ